MTNESSQLLSDNIKLIYKFFAQNSIYDEDIKQEILLRVCERLDKYDPNRAGLSTYIYQVCKSSLSNIYAYNTAKMRNDMSITRINIIDEGMNEIIASNKDYIKPIEDKLESEWIKKIAKKRLTKSEYNILLCILDNYTTKEIMNKYNVTRACVSSNYLKAVRKLRKEMNRCGYRI